MYKRAGKLLPRYSPNRYSVPGVYHKWEVVVFAFFVVVRYVIEQKNNSYTVNLVVWCEIIKSGELKSKVQYYLRWNSTKIVLTFKYRKLATSVKDQQGFILTLNMFFCYSFTTRPRSENFFILFKYLALYQWNCFDKFIMRWYVRPLFKLNDPFHFK